MHTQCNTIPQNINILSLQDIAAWTLPEIPTTNIIARIPPLQRGLVWKPYQIELFWDSVLRGFPVGSLIVCKPIPSQIIENGKGSDPVPHEALTHHLLDGQQRCHAIALGFDEPFGDLLPPVPILWLDLAPEIPKSSTRSFLVRLTTEAHPWGYSKEDTAGRITAANIRKALNNYGWRGDNEEQLKPERPQPKEAWPFDAEYPVPLAWLLHAKGNSSNEDDFWRQIKDKCRKNCDKLWAKKICDMAQDCAEQWKDIYKGMQFAMQLRLVALEVPSELITNNSRQENGVEESKDDISNVEHLFQRVNGNGTPLDGEELSYSMIKAYLPEVKTPVDDISKKYMPATRLVALGTRVALAAATKDKLPAKISVSALRTIARASKSDFKKCDEKKQIVDFFGETDKGELGRICELIDYWLVIPKDSTLPDFRLPPVLRTSIAQSSPPDVYLLLMWIARRMLANNGGDFQATIKASESLNKAIVALATSLHWFGADKTNAVMYLYDKYFRNGELAIDRFKGILADNIPGVIPLLRPDELASVITVPKEGLKDWNWWNLIKKDGQVDLNRQQNLWPFLNRVKGERELLLYGQRAYICNQFKNYDPARQDLWKDHNRPWDYDHILASALLYNNKYGDYRKVCYEWLNCTGNLRACRFENNRSDQKDPADEKIKMDELDDSLIKEDELSKFSLEWGDFSKPDKPYEFISAARERLLRIYKEWYDTVGVEILMNKISCPERSNVAPE